MKNLILSSFKMNMLVTLISLVSFANIALGEAETKFLTLGEARQIALQKHPRIAAADLQVLVSKQSLREVRSSFFPVVTGNVTAVGTPQDRNNTLSAGYLATSSIWSRQADGIDISQLITDFGRTANMVGSAKLHSRAQEQGALATKAEIILAVEAAYFTALQAQSVLAVAKQTVATRQVLFDRVHEMARNNLKSDLDESFADVDLESSRLLEANAENELQAAFATLSNLLDERRETIYKLRDEPLPARNLTNDWGLVEAALRNRPDLVQLRLEHDAADKYVRAEKDLNYPTISAFAAAGVLPIHNDAINNEYAGAGLNLRLPIFDGFLFSAREKEAQLKAQVVAENLREAENNIIRDVRIAIQNRDYALKQLELTAKLLASANKAFDLADERYQVGSSSIVELSQAQLNQTEARIGQAKATYNLQVRNAILTYQIGETGGQP